MSQHSKRDLIAAVAILLMFAGAFLLPFSSFGLVGILIGAVVILLLLLGNMRARQ